MATTPEKPGKFGRIRFRTRFTGVSWRDLAVTLVPILLVCVLAIWLGYIFIRPAPPDTIILTSGTDGSNFRTTAERYRAILARQDVKLEILPSEGSLENLKRLTDPAFRVDVGFVQGGVSAGTNIDRLVSLGSIFNQPLVIYYRSAEPIDRLSQFKGKRLAIGHEGSGTRFLSLALLKVNGIEPGGATELLDLAGEEAAQALIESRIDAAFLQADSAATAIMRKLLRTPGVQLFNFSQADAYVRRYRYLRKLEFPMGSLDFAQNLPAHTVALVGPTTELVARDDLHPALSDLLIEAAREVHGKPNLLQHAGEFPAPLEHDFPISDEASRYYKSGKSFLYRYMPFWLATLADRMVWILVPVLVLLIPALKLVPDIYRWRIRSRVYRWYGALLALERDMYAHPEPEKREELVKRLDAIEQGVSNLKMPRTYADQFYVLRQHISFVRERLRG